MRHFLLNFTLLFLVGCIQPPSDELLFLPLEPVATPAVEPFLIIEADILDAATQRPLTADVYLVHGAQYRQPTSADLIAPVTQHFAVQLPAQSDSWFILRAPGYQDWKFRFHYRLKTSRKLTGPIRLEHLPVEQQMAIT